MRPGNLFEAMAFYDYVYIRLYKMQLWQDFQNMSFCMKEGGICDIDSVKNYRCIYWVYLSIIRYCIYIYSTIHIHIVSYYSTQEIVTSLDHQTWNSPKLPTAHSRVTQKGQPKSFPRGALHLIPFEDLPPGPVIGRCFFGGGE